MAGSGFEPRHAGIAAAAAASALLFSVSCNSCASHTVQERDQRIEGLMSSVSRIDVPVVGTASDEGGLAVDIYAAVRKGGRLTTIEFYETIDHGGQIHRMT